MGGSNGETEQTYRPNTERIQMAVPEFRRYPDTDPYGERCRTCGKVIENIVDEFYCDELCSKLKLKERQCSNLSRHYQTGKKKITFFFSDYEIVYIPEDEPEDEFEWMWDEEEPPN